MKAVNGPTIVELRRHFDLTQYEMGKVLEIRDRSYISDMERGKADISVTTAVKLDALSRLADVLASRREADIPQATP